MERDWMIIVYRKVDRVIVNGPNKNSSFPEGPPLENELQNIIPTHGGTEADYAAYRLHDMDEANLVDEIFRAASYELMFENNVPVGISTHPRIKVTADKALIIANGTDDTIITADVGDSSNIDEIEFFVDEVSIGTTPAVNGFATLEFTAITKGIYTIEAESKTPGPPGFKLRHGKASLQVEAIE